MSNDVISRPAKGTRGFLLRTYRITSVEGLEDHVEPTLMFRVYNKDKTFVDYDIYHYDLEIEVVAGDADLFADQEGNSWIDYPTDAFDA